jgi:hypothetical protein
MDTPDDAQPQDNLPDDAAADALDRHLARQVQGQGRRLAAGVALVFSAFMHLSVGVFVFSSGLIAPGWAVGALIGVWTAGAYGIWRFRRVPELVLVIPMAVAAIWWVTMALGDRFLGWTA